MENINEKIAFINKHDERPKHAYDCFIIVLICFPGGLQSKLIIV